MPIGTIKNVVLKKQGEREYYFGTIGSDKITSLIYVPVIEESTRTFMRENVTGGYQRPGSLSRMRAFKKFLTESPNSVIPPVLISSRGHWDFSPLPENAEVGSLTINDMAAVIDGQHRLGGFVALFEEEEEVRPVSFILLPKLSLDDEIKEFIVVNNSQKGVPRPLTEFLLDTDEAQVAWGLNQDPDSPFYEKITRTSMSKKHLFALHSVAKQVERLFSLGSLQDLDVDAKIDYVKQLWTIIADELPNEWSDIDRLDDPDFSGRRSFEFKLLELTGLIAWAFTGAQIFHRSYGDSIGMNWDNVRRLVGETKVIDWSKEGEFAGRTGEAGGRIMASDMIRLIPPEVSEVSEG